MDGRASKSNKEESSVLENETPNDHCGKKVNEAGKITMKEEDDDASNKSSSSSLESKKIPESERMLFFTDAVAAIAATLLVLPLMDASAELASKALETGGDETEETADPTTVDNFFMWSQHGEQLLFYVLGFWMVFRLWTGHTFLFAYVDKIMSNWLIAANGLWGLTLVLVPLATTLNYHEGGWIFFFSVIEANCIVTLAMKFIIRKYQENGVSDYNVMIQVASVFWGAVAIVVAATVPHAYGAWGYFPIMAGANLSSLVLRKYLKKERYPLDEVKAYYLRTDFVHLSIGWLLRKLGIRKCGEDKRHALSHLNDDIHREIFSKISARLIIFTDATVAISMTLMIVNVSDASQDYSGSVLDFFEDQGLLLAAFCLSFAIVFVFWRVHEDVYAYEEGRVHPAFFVFTMPWLMTIAFLPVATSLFDSTFTTGSGGGVFYYVLALLLNRMISMVLVLIVFQDGVGLPAKKVVPPVMAVLLLGLTLGLSFAVTSPWSSFLLFLPTFTKPISMLLLSLWPGLPALIRKQQSANNE